MTTDIPIGIKNHIEIAVVIPAHNEEETIGQCLISVQKAIEQLPNAINVYPLVVLDNCTDNTETLVKNAGINYIHCDYQCVGKVRDLGIRHAIELGATWIACTDADTRVSEDWLLAQVNHIRHQPTDMICGVVSVDDWAHLSRQTQTDYLAHYKDTMGHHHIHGANLSFSSDSYLLVGGFADMPCHEDVDLVTKFTNQGYAITWSNQVRVVTSSRLQARASDGFAAFLTNLEKNSVDKLI